MVIKKNFILFFSIVTALIIFLDQLTKYLVFSQKPEITWGFFTLHLVKNTGAGFGILQDHTLGLAFISLTVAVIIILNYNKIPQEIISQSLFAIFLGGVIGNLIDRLARGYVIDFLDFNFWPAFNIADAVITIAIVGIIIYYWKEEKKEEIRKSE